ncbi:MAG: hypothetical protein GY843_06735 [Neptuniibacter sp.]|nr:hypothetical protein [Neptuniibacter sp.]
MATGLWGGKLPTCPTMLHRPEAVALSDHAFPAPAVHAGARGADWQSALRLRQKALHRMEKGTNWSVN